MRWMKKKKEKKKNLLGGKRGIKKRNGVGKYKC